MRKILFGILAAEDGTKSNSGLDVIIKFIQNDVLADY